MNSLDLTEVREYIEKNIGPKYHNKRLAKVKKLKLKEVLLRKNPYLFKAKNVLYPDDLIKLILDATFSSGEEATFGNFLEGLALFICEKVYGGRKSSTKGLDIEFERDGIRYFIALKSGPNWGNSSQIEKMANHFTTAKKTLATGNSKIPSVFVNGCCYGKIATDTGDKGDYLKLCGQDFWELISGNSNLYIEIIEPLGHEALEKNDKAKEAYAEIVNRFTKEFFDQFTDNGKILWEKLVKYNSASSKSGESSM